MTRSNLSVVVPLVDILLGFDHSGPRSPSVFKIWHSCFVIHKPIFLLVKTNYSHTQQHLNL